MLDELVELLEGPLVEEPAHALARGELALAVLALAPLGASALLRPPRPLAQLVEGRAGHQFRLQAPPPQGPLAQPASGVEHAPAPHPANDGAGEETVTANTESCFSTAALAHEGQATVSSKRRTRRSKRCSQPPQTYS